MTKAKPLPPVEVLRQHFSYDPETGILRWTEYASKQASRIKSGAIAGRLLNGYVQIRFKGLAYMGHRLIWAIHTGSDPEYRQVDHKNHLKSDNRWVNLRLATHGQNQANTPRWAHNPLAGTRKIGRKYQTKCSGGYLGTFDTEQEAHNAYVKWHREQYGEFSVFAAHVSSPVLGAG